MSYPQLQKLVKEKIGILKQKIRENIAQLRAISEYEAEKNSNLSESILESMDQCANETEKLPASEKEGTVPGYDNFKREINRIFVDSMELTEKVNWFSQIHSQLQRNQEEKVPLSDFVMRNTHDNQFH